MNKQKSGKNTNKKRQLQKSIEQSEIQTPRIKKSISTINQTSTKYLQLKLQISNKKRSAFQHSLIKKDHRIHQLQQQIIQNQQLVSQTLQKYKFFHKQKSIQQQKIHKFENQLREIQQKYEEQKQKNKNNQIINLQNQRLIRENLTLKRNNQQINSKYKQLKQTRKKQKQEWRQILPEFMREFHQLKKDFLNMKSQPHNLNMQNQLYNLNMKRQANKNIKL